jgi:hypothetical protein
MHTKALAERVGAAALLDEMRLGDDLIPPLKRWLKSFAPWGMTRISAAILGSFIISPETRFPADHHMTAQSVGYVSGCRHPFRDFAGLPNRPAAVTLALPKT